MNGDGLDDIIRYNNAQTLNIEYQQINGGTFSNLNYGPIGGSLWSMCVADIDGNGYNDIMAGGIYDNLKILKANNTGTNYTQTSISNPSVFLQGSNFVDIDNNGTVDIFACHDEGLSPAFSNDGFGNFTYDPSLIDASSTVPSDNSGNYGSVWTDYDNDGDLDMYLSKCRIGVSEPNDGRRINMLFQNDGNNNYTDVGVAAGLVPYAQSWAADFADIDNDGDLDCFIANHDILSQLLVNNGDGTFTDITSSTGISSNLAALPSGIQCIFDDFDNDGFVDLLYTSLNNGHELFRNNGNLTFSSVVNPFFTNGLGIQSAVTGDLDNDGYLDVYAGFAAGFNNPVSNRPDKVFINQSSGNNFVKIRLEGDSGNRNAIGARLEIHGSWGVQVREVRSGESYGIMNSMVSHFGLGTSDKIDRLVVRWPNGVTKVLCGLEINQSHTIKMEDMYDDCLYVDVSVSSGNEDGTSWENAFSDLQDALDAGANTAILIAEGTYYPTSGTSRGIFFDVPSGATILGGYESENSSRNPAIYVTTLSGDIDLDNTLSGNSFHVVRFNNSNNAVLDGISIEGGNADNSNSFGRSRGGGIYSSGSSFTLQNCIVKNNNAILGGGMFATLSNKVDVENSTFSDNIADRGAGLYHSNTTNLYVRNSRIINNNSLTRCVIESNNSLYTYIENSLIANNASSFANAIGIIATNRDQSCDIYNSTILGESLNRSLFSLQIGFGDQLDINIYNSIVGHQNAAFNKSFAIFNNNILNLNTENCYIQGSSVVGTSTNNLYSDTAGDLLLNADYSVDACSPVINQGNNTYATLLRGDIDGNERIFDTTVDIGAYEAQTVCPPFRETMSYVSKHKVFPNPVSDILTIQLDETTASDMNIQVFDIKGQMMKMTTIPTGGFSTDVDVSQWSEGVYILHFIGTEIESRKFVVSK